ncbi:MAG TPA: glycosyltransferase family 2 protein [Saprospiraceae bacterium]|nr:glycosyltransferase family 2 protein [Saprospiraceae bacterium]
MENNKPYISLLMYTYNRPHLLGRSLDSVLNQTFQDFEIILINNGSDEPTKKLLKNYEDNSKIRIFHFEKNRGYIGAFNFAIEQIRGEWFSELSDDDFLEKDAFETLLKIPNIIDPSINAVSCNGHDTATGGWSGLGLDRDQYLPLSTIVEKCGGDFWGITKTKLIGNNKLNTNLRGLENTFWYKIDAAANRYYIHQQLMTYDTAHDKRETNVQEVFDFKEKAIFYTELLNEKFYWEAIKKYNHSEFIHKCFCGLLFLKMENDKVNMNKYVQMLNNTSINIMDRLMEKMIIETNPTLLKKMYKFSKNKLALSFSKNHNI